jgi:hypothetical protein
LEPEFYSAVRYPPCWPVRRINLRDKGILGFQVSGFGFRVSGFGFRVSGFKQGKNILRALKQDLKEAASNFFNGINSTFIDYRNRRV